MNKKREISIHLRLTDTLHDIAEKAIMLQLSFFQCFLVIKSTGRLIHPTQAEINEFLALRRAHFGKLYVHGSYWINLAGVAHHGHKALDRELYMARKLEFTHMILHPGAAKGVETKAEGIDVLARALNTLAKKEREIIIVLENSAHAGLSVGGDIHDFALLLTKLDYPEKLLFCIDTAHAYSYGYDIAQPAGRLEFIQLLEETIGIERITLIHLNDTSETCGSRIDQHATLGAGTIGQEALKAFALDGRLVQIPLLMELPVLPVEQEQKVLEMVRGWHQ